MAITYPLSVPTVNVARRLRFAMNSIVGMSASPFSGAQQVYAHAGQFWGCEVELPPMERAAAAEWVGFLLSLNGREGTFLMGDPVGATARGAATGTPLVRGASQTGNSLNTDGWSNSITGILKAGDYIQLGSGTSTRLHQLRQDADSNGSGEATLEIWPAIRTAPADNAAITVVNCKGHWRLAENVQSWDIDLAAIFGLRFSCIEAF